MTYCINIYFPYWVIWGAFRYWVILLGLFGILKSEWSVKKKVALNINKHMKFYNREATLIIFRFNQVKMKL